MQVHRMDVMSVRCRRPQLAVVGREIAPYRRFRAEGEGAVRTYLSIERDAIAETEDPTA